MREPDRQELDLPFFARDSTKHYATSLSRCQGLVVYAGAGVSIDRTGLSWAALVESLLVRRVPFCRDIAPELVRRLDPVRAASVIAQFISETDENPQTTMASAIRDLIYQQGGSLHGFTSVALADLAIEMLGSGRHLGVLTTNYDEYFLEDFAAQLDFWRAICDLRLAEPDIPDGLRGRADVLEGLAQAVPPVAFLHGRLPRNGTIEADNLPVLSEGDYLRAGPAVHRALVESFSKSSVLIIGASVTDPPLVQALLDTRETARQQGLARYALLPRSDLGAELATDPSFSLLRAWQQRLSHLGVQGIFIDLMSQVGQFLREVQVATSATDYASSSSRHGERLNRWWEGWAAGIADPGGYAARQARDHSRLRDLLPTIADQLNAAYEQLKVEVWLRWAPDKGHRELRLWASSYAHFTDPQLMRSVSLVPTSDARNRQNAALSAFRQGRPVHMPDNEAARWKSYLAAPIQVSTDEVNLVVGSVVISSMQTQDKSRLGPDYRPGQAKALGAARLGVEQIATGLPAGESA